MVLVIQDGSEVIRASIEGSVLILERLKLNDESGDLTTESTVRLDKASFPQIEKVEASFFRAAEQLRVLLELGGTDNK